MIQSADDLPEGKVRMTSYFPGRRIYLTQMFFFLTQMTGRHFFSSLDVEALERFVSIYTKYYYSPL